MGADLTITISNSPKFAAVLFNKNIIVLTAEQIHHVQLSSLLLFSRLCSALHEKHRSHQSGKPLMWLAHINIDQHGGLNYNGNIYFCDSQQSFNSTSPSCAQLIFCGKLPVINIGAHCSFNCVLNTFGLRKVNISNSNQQVNIQSTIN